MESRTISNHELKLLDHEKMGFKYGWRKQIRRLLDTQLHCQSEACRLPSINEMESDLSNLICLCPFHVSDTFKVDNELFRVSDISVQYLQSISEDEVDLEGIYRCPCEGGGFKFGLGEQEFDTKREAFQDYCEQIFGRCAWSENPLVWVVSAEKYAALNDV